MIWLNIFEKPFAQTLSGKLEKENTQGKKKDTGKGKEHG